MIHCDIRYETLRYIWYNIIWYGIWYHIWCGIWYDAVYNTIYITNYIVWHDMVWCDATQYMIQYIAIYSTWHITMYDMIWCNATLYMLWYGVVYDIIYYMVYITHYSVWLWYGMVRHDICCDTVILYDMMRHISMWYICYCSVYDNIWCGTVQYMKWSI